MTKQQDALRIVGKFLLLQSKGYPATKEECKRMADLCFILLPMKYRLSQEELKVMQQEASDGIVVASL